VVYVSDRVRADARCAARLGRMMRRIECGRVVDVTDDEIERLVRENRWDQSRRYTGTRKQGDPPILFNRYRWPSEAQQQEQRLRCPGGRKGHFFGFDAFTFRDRQAAAEKENIVCQSAWEVHTISGCLFKCSYCFLENFLNIMLDLEQWAERLEKLIDDNPWQSLYKYDNWSDVLAFEPEYGVSEVLVPLFAGKPNAYLMHYTKSSNVDHLLGLDHGGHTLMCWSLSAHTQSRVVEIDTAPMEDRIGAAAKCQEAGYPVRFRLSPIIPLKGWREENRRMIRMLLSKVRPEVISLQTLSRFAEYEIVERVFDTELFDGRFLEGMRSRPEELRGRLYGPIPHALRAEIYRFCIGEIRAVDPDVPLSLCLESKEMWDDLEGRLGICREGYPCCCGPQCVPGDPVMKR
jgi:spore photoproduct lyase